MANFMGNPPMNFIDGVIEQNADQCGLRIGKSFIQLPPQLQKKLAAYVGHKIKAGFRSHQMQTAEPGENALPLEIAMVENL